MTLRPFRLSLALTLVALTTLAGCSHVPMRGIVIKKQHRGAWTQFMPVSTGKTTIIVPIHHPEQWDVVVQEDGTDGDTGQFLVVVSRSAWDSLDVGDVWQRGDTVYQAEQQ